MFYPSLAYMIQALETSLSNIPNIDRLISIVITFLFSSVFSTLITLYATKGVRRSSISETISRYANNVTQDAERLLSRLEKTEASLEKSRKELEACRKDCERLRNRKV